MAAAGERGPLGPIEVFSSTSAAKATDDLADGVCHPYDAGDSSGSSGALGQDLDMFLFFNSEFSAALSEDVSHAAGNSICAVSTAPCSVKDIVLEVECVVKDERGGTSGDVRGGDSEAESDEEGLVEDIVVAVMLPEESLELQLVRTKSSDENKSGNCFNCFLKTNLASDLWVQQARELYLRKTGNTTSQPGDVSVKLLQATFVLDFQGPRFSRFRANAGAQGDQGQGGAAASSSAGAKNESLDVRVELTLESPVERLQFTIAKIGEGVNSIKDVYSPLLRYLFSKHFDQNFAEQSPNFAEKNRLKDPYPDSFQNALQKFGSEFRQQRGNLLLRTIHE